MSRERRIAARRLFLAILSGVFFALSFPPVDLGLLAWIALVPLLLAVDDLQPGDAFRLGYFGGLGGWLLVVSWIRMYGLPVWLLLSAYLALQFAVFAGVHRWIAEGRRPWIGIASIPLIWTGLEFLRSIGPVGFPWALLGLSQHTHVPVVQIARVTGVFGVSCLVALGSACVFGVLRRHVGSAAVSAVVIALVVGWGSQTMNPAGPAPMTVAALQPNVDPRAKFDPRYAGQIMADLEQLVLEAGRANPQLVIFPETAVPVNLFGQGGALDDVGRWAHASRATIVASSLEDGRSNTAVSVSPSGLGVDRYDKVRLVAFGEAGIFPGTQYKPLWTPVGPLGVAICFESIFPEATRALTRNGADLIAIITNDAVIATNSGLDRWAGPEQHAAHAVLRAVESGRWVVRAANTGLTRLIDPSGRVRGEINRGRRGVLAGEVALTRHRTIYAQHGDLFSVGILIASLVLAVPRLMPLLAMQWSRPDVRQAAAGTVLPAIAVTVLLRARVAEWVWMAVLTAFVAIFSTVRRPTAWGLSARGAVPSIALGLGVILVLWLLMTNAYRAQQIPILLTSPTSGWWRAGLTQLLVAGAIECWLRGYAFSALMESFGTVWTVALTGILGVVMQIGLTPESYAWAMVTGVAFGLIRARTGNTIGPIAGHALGNMLMSAITIVR